MVEIPEHAVKAAWSAYVSFIGNAADGIADAKEAVLHALTAAAPHMSGVKVKQLEWERYREQYHDRDQYHVDNIKLFWRANSLNGGWYRIEMHHTETGYNGRCVYGGMTFPTVEQAKAAAQSDFEKRIMSAIEPSSAFEQVLEEVFQILQKYSDHPSEVVSFVMVEIWDAIRALTSAASHMSASAREQALDDDMRMGIIDLLHNLRFRLEDSEATIETDRKLVGQIIEMVDALKSQPTEQQEAGMSKLIVEAITEHYGERCPDFDAECFCCKVWDEYDALVPPAPRDELKTVEYQYKPGGNEYWTNTTRHKISECKARGWQTRKLITRQNAEEVIAAKDARIKELEMLLELKTEECAQLANSLDGSEHLRKAAEADNKRLREALSEIADGNFLFPSEFRFSARAALGEVKP